ncbi:MAG: tetratricopeptide repeat protein [Limisphaerales bacterium]
MALFQSPEVVVAAPFPARSNNSTFTSQVTRLPTFFTNAPPEDYSPKALAGALRQKLTADEMSLVINPLEGTPQMGNWAREMTAGGTNDLEKARVLFVALLGHLPDEPPRAHRTRPAQEAFSAWNTPRSWFSCQELTYLYVALARAAGLKAHCVWVLENCYGRKDAHSCAAVFLNGDALLADLTYEWFGAPHKRFAVLDDAQTAGIHLASFGDLKSCQVACKLAPSLAFVRGGVFHGLAVEGRWEEAREELAAMTRLDPEAPETLESAAGLAYHEGKLDEEVRLLRQAIVMAPHTAPLHLMLGSAYARQGKLSEARAAFEDALRYPMDEKRAEAAKQSLDWIKDQTEHAGAGGEQQPLPEPRSNK